MSFCKNVTTTQLLQNITNVPKIALKNVTTVPRNSDKFATDQNCHSGKCHHYSKISTLENVTKFHRRKMSTLIQNTTVGKYVILQNVTTSPKYHRMKTTPLLQDVIMENGTSAQDVFPRNVTTVPKVALKNLRAKM
ncbi:hypothetical protein BgiBS90_033118 [Biomphalaria glabrata]|nr:hypothetical protein BgiBS90_033118 [Biomphalaria glabrata]